MAAEGQGRSIQRFCLWHLCKHHVPAAEDVWSCQRGCSPLSKPSYKERLHCTLAAIQLGVLWQQSIVDLQTMVNVATLQSVAQPCSHAWTDGLIANITDMAAPSGAKENIYVWPRHKIV